jgi:hypothetical protein
MSHHGFEAAHMATDALVAVPAETLPHETTVEAIRALQTALERPGVEVWRVQMIAAAVSHLSGTS